MTILRTERLILRPLALSDAPHMAKFMLQADVARMTGSFPYPNIPISIEGWIQIGLARKASGIDEHRFAITTPADDLIGGIALHPCKDGGYELGYWIGQPFWGKGYASEAAAAVAQFAAARSNGPIMATVFADNPASGRVLTKAGFKTTGDRPRLWSTARGRKDEGVAYTYQAAAQAA
jgi:RimJ/RimL family protein N-acetyltransferase